LKIKSNQIAAAVAVCACLTAITVRGGETLAASGTSPGPASVLLGAGSVGRDYWSAKLQAPVSAQDRDDGALCLLLAVGGLELSACTTRRPEARPVIKTLRTRWKGHDHIVVAMLFTEDAEKLILKVRGKKSQSFRLKSIPVDQDEPVSGVPLSSFAHGYAGSFCIQKLSVLDAEGKKIGDLGRQPCA
jgi:hypothetical protein